MPRRHWVAVTVSSLAVTAAEAGGALLVLALLSVLLARSDRITLPLLGDVSRTFPGADPDTLIVWFACGVAVFFVVRAGILTANAYIVHRVVQGLATRLSRRLLRGYLATPYEEHLLVNSAERIRNAYTAVQELVNNAALPLVNLVAEAATALAILTVLFLTSPIGTLLIVGLFLPVLGVTLAIVQPRMKKLGLESQRSNRALIKHLQQSLTGFRDVVLLNRQQYFEESFVRTRRRLAKTQYTRAALAVLPRAVVETTSMVAIAALLAVVTLAGRSVGEILSVLGLFGYAALRLQPSVNTIVMSVNNLRYGSAVINDISADLAVADAQAARTANAHAALPLERELEFDRVSYTYPRASTPALDDVSFVIPAGSMTAFVGETGSGKSTILDLMAGLLTPTAGAVRVDGHDLRSLGFAWRESLGVVSQSLFLLDDSIENNVAFGDANATPRDLATAVSMARLDELLERLPSGLATVIGEQGSRLSGGQRQRVAFARALYRRPSVLLVDEGTSALDSVTEKALLDEVREVAAGRTVIMVAHRLSTVRSCDAIHVIDKGRLVASGTFDELLDRSPIFRSLARSDQPSA